MTLPEGIFIKQKTKEKNVMNKTEFIAAVAEKDLRRRPPRRLLMLLSLASEMLLQLATRFRSQVSVLSR